MVIDDEDVGRKFLRQRHGLETRCSAVDGDDQFRTLFHQGLERRDVRSITFEDPVGYVDSRRRVVCPQKPRHQRRRARAVHVVVAKDRHGLAPLNCIRDTLRHPVHARKGRRIRHERLDARIEEHRHVTERNAARRQHPPSNSGSPCCWLIASAKFCASCASRSRHTNPRAEWETPRKAAASPALSARALLSDRNHRSAPSNHQSSVDHPCPAASEAPGQLANRVVATPLTCTVPAPACRDTRG